MGLVINPFSLQNSVNSDFKIVMCNNHIVHYIKNLTPIRMTIFLHDIRILSHNINVAMFDFKTDDRMMKELLKTVLKFSRFSSILI